MPGAESLPTLVFLHEGLGSIGLWRSFQTFHVYGSGRYSGRIGGTSCASTGFASRHGICRVSRTT